MQQINSSIWNKRVVYHNGYRDDSGIQFLIKAGRGGTYSSIRRIKWCLYMKNNLKYLPILIFATLALGFVLGGMLNFPVADFSNKNNSRSKLNKLIDFIDNEYVDNVNTDSIVNRR
jgi:hypothetical protein